MLKGVKVGDFVEASYTEAIAGERRRGEVALLLANSVGAVEGVAQMRAQVEAIACASPAFTTLLLSVIMPVLRASRRSTTRASTAPSRSRIAP